MPLNFDDILGTIDSKTNGLNFDDIVNNVKKPTIKKGLITYDDILGKPEKTLTTEPKSLSINQLFKGYLAASKGVVGPEAFIQPITKSMGMETPKEMITGKVEKGIQKEAVSGEASWIKNFLKSFTSGSVGDIINIASTPITYTPIPIGKALGKIPIRGTTLGEIATKVPLGQILKKDVATIVKYQTALKDLPTRVAASRAPLTVRKIDPVKKITQALKATRPLRGEQEKLYSLERTKRAEAMVRAGKEVPGEKGFFAQLHELKGELPKVKFEGVRDKITQTDIDSLFNIVEQNQNLLPYEKITAKVGLAKLIGKEGVSLPTRGEINLLRGVFSKEFISTVLDKRTLLQKGGELTIEVLNVPRALMSSFDMSAPFRQGIFLAVKHPIRATQSFKEMFKYFFNERSYKGLMNNIKSRPTYALMKKTKLPLTEMGQTLAVREEAFMSTLAEKIPVGIGKVVKASNRAYSGFLNKLRADVFDDLVGSAQKLGLNIEGKLGNDIANFVGAATGRGGLGRLQSAAVVLNSTFFSPRLMASRLQLLNPAYYMQLHPFVRKEALKSLFAFTGVGMTTLGLAKLGGAKVGVDPRTADFGKIKIGNTRYDIWGGFQQYIRITAQLMTGKLISSTTGVEKRIGEGYKPVTNLDILQRFIETKSAPVASFVISLLRGKTFLGKDVEVEKEIAQRVTPMVVQDMIDLYKERGIPGLAMSTPAIFGIGLQTYAPTATDVVYSKNSVLRHSKELAAQGRVDDAKKLITQNTQLLLIGEKLEPMQDNLKTYQKAKEIIKKSVFLNSKTKKEQTSLLDKKIKDIEEKMEIRYKDLLTQF